VSAYMIRNMGGSEDRSADHGGAGARIKLPAVKARRPCQPGHHPLNDVIREMVEAFRTMFGLPPQVVDALEQDRHKLKMDVHQYVSHLLFERYEQLRHGKR
jgi:hypothetical protein